MKAGAGFASGLLFAVGLVLGGMTQPAKVVGFLDAFGAWDPSLALVMGGALGVHALLRIPLLRRGRPLFDPRFHVPASGTIDAPLLVGAALFGVGWGIAGFCPGPALVAAGAGAPAALVFVPAMLAGMLLHDRLLAGGRGARVLGGASGANSAVGAPVVEADA